MILYLPAHLSRRICLAGTTTSNIQVKLSRHIVTYCSYLTPQSTRGVGSDLWYTSYIVVHTRLDYEHATSSLMLRTPDIVGMVVLKEFPLTLMGRKEFQFISLFLSPIFRETNERRLRTVNNGRQRSTTPVFNR